MEHWEGIERNAGRVFGLEIILSVFLGTVLAEDADGEALADRVFANSRLLASELPNAPGADGARDAVDSVEQITRAVLHRLKHGAAPPPPRGVV